MDGSLQVAATSCEDAIAAALAELEGAIDMNRVRRTVFATVHGLGLTPVWCEYHEPYIAIEVGDLTEPLMVSPPACFTASGW